MARDPSFDEATLAAERRVGTVLADKWKLDKLLGVADTCEDDEAQACSVDMKQLLACKGKKMTLGEKCKKACVVSGETVSCN